MAPKTPDMQRQQSGFTALDSLRNNQLGLKLPDFSMNNQFQGNPMARASSGLGGSPTSFAANPFGMTGGAAAASANLPTFGGATGGGGGAGSAIASSAAKIVASNEKLVAALNNLASKLGGGGGGGKPGMPGAPGGGGGRLTLGSVGMGASAAFAGISASYGFGTQQMGLQANAMAAANQETYFNQGMGGLGSSFRSMGVNQSVANAKRDSSGNTVSGIGAGTMALGGLATLGGVLAAPFTGGASLTVAGYGLATMGVGGGLMTGGNMAANRAAEEARIKGQDKNSAEYQAALEKDRLNFNAKAGGAVRGTTSVGQYYNALSQFPGGEGASAIQRASRYKRTAARFNLMSSVGNNTIIPMEQAGFEFMANVSMHSGRYTRFLDDQGRANMHDFLGGQDASVTSMSGLFGNALGMSNITATQEMNAIVSGQGFRGIEHTQLNGSIDRALMRPKNARQRKNLRRIIKAGDPDGLLVRGVTDTPFNTDGVFQQDHIAEMAASPHATAAANMTGAGQRQIDAYDRAPARLLRSNRGYAVDQDVLASGTNDYRDNASLRRSNHNRAMGINEVINARQRGFSASLIGLAGQIGRGGMGGLHSAGGSDLINEAAYMDLRGAGAQQHIQGRLDFFSKMAASGFNPSSGGFNMYAGRDAQIGLRGPGTPMLFQRGFSDTQMQMEGEINTVINRGRARRLQSFMGGNFGARAGEMRGFAESGAQGIKGILGGFGNDVLMASVLAENNGDIAGSMRTMHGMGPLSARNRFMKAGLSGQGLRDALLSLPGMSPDTVDTILESPDRLENLSQKRRSTLGSMAEKSAGGAKAEKEIQRMEAFNHNTFRMMTAAEANKEANETSKTTLGNIEKFLKDTFNKQKAKKAPPPAPSDIRLKKAITFLRKSLSGINIYSWIYKKDKTETIWEGVMAQEIMNDYPEAVMLDTDGYYKVYYDKIDVDMKRIG